MARTGVGFQNIEKAAQELKGLGKTPTVDGIREILGTGSKSTIAKYLREWRAQQAEMEGELPHELSALVTGLWKRLNSQADQRIDDAVATYRQRSQELNQTISELHQSQTHLKNQLHRAEEIASQERTAKQHLEKELQQQRLELTQLQEKLLSATKQLEISQADNARLHQISQNIQTNLEHYQEKMHEQQLQLTMQTEKQLALYTQEITLLKQQLNQQYEQIKTLTLSKESLQAQFDQQTSEHQKSQAEHKNIQTQLQSALSEKNRLLDRSDLDQKTITDLQSKLDTTTNLWQQLEKKVAILEDQNLRLQNDAAQAQDKVHTLRQEKLFLVQEKSQLEGFLKKMEQPA